MKTTYIIKQTHLGVINVYAFILLILCGNFLVAAGSESTAAGHWEGSLKLPTTDLQIRLDFESTEHGISGSIDIPAQGMLGYKLVDIEVTSDEIAFALPEIPGDPRFEGSFSEDKKTITGHLSQSGQIFPFDASRVEKTVIKGQTPSRGIPGDGLAGWWQGSLHVNAFEMRLLLKIEFSDDGLTGTFSSLDQNAHNIPVSNLGLDGKAVQFEIESASARYAGQLVEDGSEVVGTWSQGSNHLPLTFRRLEAAPVIGRPQEPVKPYPYREEAVIIENSADNVLLSGTLTLPKGAGPHPAVVLITGSGPQDRDQSIMGHRPFLVIADRLAKAGIATLRYDDRGFAESTGDFHSATTEDFTRDALVAFEFLQSHSEIRSGSIGLIGHSEGGLIAPQAAAANHDIAFIVLLAGVGIPMDELLAQQSQDMIRLAGGDAEVAAFQADLQSKVFAVIKSSSSDTDLPGAVRGIIRHALAAIPESKREAFMLTDNQIEAEVQRTTTPWFRHILKIDPRVALREVRCPVLAVNGDKDVQVASKQNLSSIQTALETGGNSNITIIEFPGLNHLFQACETGAIHEYSTIEETFNEEALGVITAWISETAL